MTDNRPYHNIDDLGDDRYAIADKENHGLFVYDAETNGTVREHVYAEHYPDSAGGGEDFTHVSDIDAVDTGSHFLASPRKDDYEILHEQHNPTLLERDPPTVLVADSENDRIVEYRRTNGEWTQIWAFPPKLPELNPVESCWDRLQKRFKTRLIPDLSTLKDRLQRSLPTVDEPNIWKFLCP